MKPKWPNLRIEQSGSLFRVVAVDGFIEPCRTFNSKREAKAWAESIYGCGIPWKDLPKPKKQTPKTHGKPKLQFRVFENRFPDGIDIDELMDFLSQPEQWEIPERMRKVLELRFGFRGTPKTYRQIGEALEISDSRAKQLIIKAVRSIYFLVKSLQVQHQ